ncbi:Cytochrome P450 [Gossypium australe]|uniref:Cytochrome P450 n=1 Tax=Gossypium australe TaxID=47621 RepID=A0A5B6WKA4_9ROSI|nr:Cytochrome P450 [Gossypium australe]
MAEYASRGFLSIALVPWGDQWKKRRKVMASNVINPSRLSWLLHKRTREADNLVRFIYNEYINHENMHGSVINMRLAVRQYTGNMIRRMMFNTRYFGKGREDGGPRYEEEQHVESLFTVLMNLNSFILSDYVPWLRPLDLEGQEKIAMAEMLNNPEILRKATDEIDSVVGKTFNIPHVSNADTTIVGYFIPKGSCVLISRRGFDPKVWEEPLEFKPERHLKDEWGSGRKARVHRGGTWVRSDNNAVCEADSSFTLEVPPNVTKIDLSESEDDTLSAKPLHALAKPCLSPALYTHL